MKCRFITGVIRSPHRKNTFIAEDDSKGLESLIQYIARCPFSLGRIIKLTDTGQMIYKTEHGGGHRFPDSVSDDLKGGVARNFHTAEQ